MKKLLIALGLTLSFGFVQAQSSVTIYGLLDVGVINANNVGANNGNTTQVLSSPMDTSRLGFTGREDLGGGSYSGFKLESQINPGDGTQGISASTGAANGTFSRAANVFLGNNDYGRLTLGRQDNLGFEAYNYGDVNGGKNYGGSLIFWNDGSSFGGASGARTGIATMTGTTFLSNAIRYDSPTFAGFRVSGLVVASGATDNSALGNTSASQRSVVALTYNQGPWAGAVSFMNSNNANASSNAQVTTVGGNYTFNGGHKVAVGYASFNNPSTTGANSLFNLYEVSGLYQFTSRISGRAGYYQLQDVQNANNGAKMWSLVGQYDFSKRTSAYVGVASMINDGASGFAPYGGGSANLNSMYASTASYPNIMQQAGQVQTGIVTGMTVKF
jgi:predicted porin